MAAKQNQTKEGQDKKQNRLEFEPGKPVRVFEPVIEPTPAEDYLLNGPQGMFSQARVDHQAARMLDPRLSEGERHFMADQIGRQQGNLYLQRVIATMRTEQGPGNVSSDGKGRQPASAPLSGRSNPTLQTKLTVNEPDDLYEQEADQVAEAVMQMPDPHQMTTLGQPGEDLSYQNEASQLKEDYIFAQEIDSDEAQNAVEAKSPEDLQAAVDSRGVMDREVAEAATESNVTVDQEEGKPAILEPTEEPESPEEQASNLPDVPQVEAKPEPKVQDQGQETQTAVQTAIDSTQTQVETATQQLVAAGSEARQAVPEPGGELTVQPGEGPPNPDITDSADATLAEVTEQVSPEAIREGLPDQEPSFEEFLEFFESERTLEEDKAEAEQLVASLETSAEQEKAAILAEAEIQKAEVMALAEEQSAFIQATLAEQTTVIQELYAGARAELQASAEQLKSNVIDQVTAEIEQVNTDTETRITDAEAQLTQRKTDFLDFVSEQQQQPSLIAQSEIARAHAELDVAAQEAIGIGEAEAGRRSDDDAQSAAREVAAESAADIQAKKSDIAQDLQSRAAEFAAKYPEYGQKVAEQIEEVRANLVPAMREKSTQTITELETGREATLQSIEQELQIELQKLQTAETTTIAKLEAAANTSVTQVTATADEAVQGIDAAAQVIATQIEQTASSVASIISEEEEPHLPGVIELVEGTRANLAEMVATGSTELSELKTAAGESIGEIVTTFETQATELVATAQEDTTTIVEEATTALAEIEQSRQEAAQTALATLAAKHEEMLATALAEIDPAIAAACEEVLGLTEQFRSELRPATDESIEEAKKPLTDPLPARVAEAADQAEESWLSGLVRAIGDIAFGLLVLVAVALVVAAIAAAFGVILTAWTAIMIAGAILLLVGLGLALYHRFNQQELADEPWWAKVGLAVMDTIGVTGIVQAITGEDIVTGRELSAGERTHGGVTGAFTLVMLALGARAAVKGPPGGVYTRPTGLPRGWVGLRNVLPSAWRGVRSVAGELYTGLSEGVQNLREWFQKRFGRGRETEPVIDSPEPPVETPEQPGEGPGPRPGEEPSGPQPGETPEQPIETPERPVEVPERPGEAPERPGEMPEYNPAGRTRAELEADMDPTPRPGETPEQAAQRARLAEEELLQRIMETYEGLGEEPPHIDLRAHEAQHPGSHPTERHGADIPLRRSDAAPGQKTIEGRIYGDPPWDPNGANASSRWVSDDVMNQSVNRYLQQNWETIRSDLAMDGEHVNTFNPGEGVVGEGFRNPLEGLPGAGQGRGPGATVQPVYVEYGRVTIVIRLVPGNPPSFVIVTAYPTF